ncbi:hypothetical protein R1flu_025807 [Riccia fluitans]|uniref:Uncharacterized protein n=1 Tax=Riccia fluitans TaxID=41844 RepID=A0ABD1XYS9_9MARC
MTTDSKLFRPALCAVNSAAWLAGDGGWLFSNLSAGSSFSLYNEMYSRIGTMKNGISCFNRIVRTNEDCRNRETIEVLDSIGENVKQPSTSGEKVCMYELVIMPL